jgi:multicomponent Na+:H+ antiporter subunit F
MNWMLASEPSMLLLAILGVGVLLAFTRLVRGPRLPDRVVALDLMSTQGVGICAVYAVAVDEPVYLDVAIVLALVAFLGTVAFARFVELRGE